MRAIALSCAEEQGFSLVIRSALDVSRVARASVVMGQALVGAQGVCDLLAMMSALRAEGRQLEEQGVCLFLGEQEPPWMFLQRRASWSLCVKRSSKRRAFVV